ncbi:MAG: c-type cytochrome domain-containing protein [Saprospiraceae bacterium]
MKSFPKLLSNISFFLAVLLLFLCVVQDKIALPPILQSTGRMHPLILHFPIVLTIVLAGVWFSKTIFHLPSMDRMFDLLFQWTVCLGLLSSLLGLFLSKEGGYDDKVLFNHKYLTIGFSFLLYTLSLLYSAGVKPGIISTGLIACIGLMVFGTHFGAELTHGAGFILKPLEKDKADNDSLINPSLFAATIQPILQSKCYSCHNEHKLKGGLDMTSIEKLLKGGDDGPIWIAGDAEKSLMMQNIHLPLDDKKHMPPNGKNQLTADEILLLHTWIHLGANTDSLLKQYPPTDTLYKLAIKTIQSAKAEIKKYSFEPANPKLIASLNDPFCTISPIAQNSPALKADFYVREKYNPLKTQDLIKIKDQLVSLNMDNMPVNDAEAATISKFISLEELNLNNSSITIKGLEELKKLQSLRVLSLAGVKLDTASIRVLNDFPSLKRVYLWNTGIKDSTLNQPGNKIDFNMGYIPDDAEVLTLTPPTFVNDDAILDSTESIIIKHQIPGVEIRYTINDSIPDSTSSPLYEKPIAVTGYTTVKARAVKSGWLKSAVAEFSAFKKGLKPSNAWLLSRPNPKYQNDGYTLINDQKGNIGNLLEPGWIAYRETPMDVLFYFDNPPTVHRISVSYDKSVNSYIVPPTEAILLAGNDSSNLKVIKNLKLKPLEKSDLGKFRNEVLDIDFSPSVYKYYRLKLQNVLKLPPFHPGKGQPGWLFVDEVFFY